MDPKPDQDPRVFGPPGSRSGSISQRYRSGSATGSASGSGSISQRHGSADPDPHQNVMDPQHWWIRDILVRIRIRRSVPLIYGSGSMLGTGFFVKRRKCTFVSAKGNFYQRFQYHSRRVKLKEMARGCGEGGGRVNPDGKGEVPYPTTKSE